MSRQSIFSHKNLFQNIPPPQKKTKQTKAAPLQVKWSTPYIIGDLVVTSKYFKIFTLDFMAIHHILPLYIDNIDLEV